MIAHVTTKEIVSWRNSILFSFLIPYKLQIQERTALHYAALNNRSDVIRFLLEKGADVDYQDCNVSFQESKATPVLICFMMCLFRIVFHHLFNKF